MSSTLPSGSQGARQIAAVLLWDRDLGYRQNLASALASVGYEVLQTADSEEGLRILSESRVDIVLLGESLPERTGRQICQRIRQTSGLNEIPLLLLLARDDPDSVIGALDAGADDCLLKSIDLEVLKAKLRAQLRRSGVAAQTNGKDSHQPASAVKAGDQTELDATALDLLQQNVDAAGVLELIDAILADAPKHLAAISLALQTNDSATLVMQAHQLKTSTALCGGMKISAEAAQLEAMGSAGRLANAAQAVTSLRSRIARFSAELRDARRKWAGR